MGANRNRNLVSCSKPYGGLLVSARQPPACQHALPISANLHLELPKRFSLPWETRVMSRPPKTTTSSFLPFGSTGPVNKVSRGEMCETERRDNGCDYCTRLFSGTKKPDGVLHAAAVGLGGFIGDDISVPTVSRSTMCDVSRRVLQCITCSNFHMLAPSGLGSLRHAGGGSSLHFKCPASCSTPLCS